MVVTGYLSLLVVPPHKRVWLYRWLRLRTRLDHRTEEVITLGLACVGLGMFALYACLEVAAAQHFRRPTPAALLAVWIAAEVRDARRGRALAVVGLWLAGQATWRTAFHAARALAQKIGDRVLDVQAGHARRPIHSLVAVDDAQTISLSKGPPGPVPTELLMIHLRHASLFLFAWRS